MNDWETFTDCMPWVIDENASIELSDGRDVTKLANAVGSDFPTLANLLRHSTTTSVSIDTIKHELFAWDSPDYGRIGWLCLAPSSRSDDKTCRKHRQLLQHFGGIVERFNEPDDTLLLNLDSALTNYDASFDATFIDNYSYMFDGEIPIVLSDFYTLAREANGNTTICHRNDGSVLLFAPDHSFDNLSPLTGCPEFTLYNVDNVSIFTEWVEQIANQWALHTEIAA